MQIIRPLCISFTVFALLLLACGEEKIVEVVYVEQSNPELEEDIAKPMGAISIANGADYTKTMRVTLTFSVTDTVGEVLEMTVSNNSSFVGAEWGPYTESKSWELTGVNGTNPVYAKFKNNQEEVSIPVLDDIVLDNIPPSILVTSPIEGEKIKASSGSGKYWVWIDFVATDNIALDRIASEGIYGPSDR